MVKEMPGELFSVVGVFAKIGLTQYDSGSERGEVYGRSMGNTQAQLRRVS
jgi:hypothetical protein